jgi:hypothetical protein
LGLLDLICAVGLLACHGAMTLAFRG